MNKKYVFEENLFKIPVGDHFGMGPESVTMLYAPFTGSMLLADKNGMAEINDEQLNLLRTKDDINRQLSKVKRMNDIQKMAILPNHTCNFNCSYCYSAKGRSNIVLDKGKLKAGLDYFIDPKRLQERHLSISFIGGGEPLLSWDLVKFGVEYASELASKHGFEILMTLITNGSIMNDEIIDTLKNHHILPDVSFDVLEDAQNKNRRHFNLVCQNIDMLCQHQLVPSINATITPDTVERMEEMVAFMTDRFPAVKNMVFEPVVSDEVFTTAAQLHDFYEKYLNYFFKAKNMASLQGRYVTCRIYKNVDSLLERGCPSKFTLTPQGDISICYCKSSPKEKKFAERTYGTVKCNTVELNEDKFNRIHQINVHSFKKCADCFAKWHCGGGCMCPNDLYNDDYLEEVCVFTKELVKRTLLERMEESCKQRFGKKIIEVYHFDDLL